VVTIWNSNGSVLIPYKPLQDSLFYRSTLGTMGTTERGVSNRVEFGKQFTQGMIHFSTVKKSVAETIRQFILIDTDCGNIDFSIQGDGFDFGLGKGVEVSGCKIIDYASTQENAYRTGTFLKYDIVIKYFYFDIAEQFHGLRKGAG